MIQIVVGAAIYGFVAWVPTFLVQHGMAINRSLGQAVLMSFGGPAGAALAYLLTDRIGRRPAIIGASLLAALCGPAFAHAPSQAAAVVLGFVMFSLIYFLVSVTVAGYIPELFPTPVRMRGQRPNPHGGAVGDNLRAVRGGRAVPGGRRVLCAQRDRGWRWWRRR